MQSSYNLIKSNSALVTGGKKIETRHRSQNDEENFIEDLVQIEVNKEQELMKSYEVIGANIISKAKSDAQRMIVLASESIKASEKEAYERGYEQGNNNGYEDGYSTGYNKAIADGNEVINKIINNANSILNNSILDYENYMADKRNEIINLALQMAKILAKKEFAKEDSVLNLIEPIIEDCKGEDNLVIRCNEIYSESIKGRISFWKNAYNIKGEIFVLGDPLMEEGNAVVEKKTGKVVVGMDVALERLEEVVKEQCLGGRDD